MDRLNWSKLKTFYKVASCGSFARAAEKFHVTSSALSKMVKSLEYELNCQLFTRNESGIELTPKGQLLYRDAIRISNMLEFTEEAILSDQGEIKKHLKLVAPTALSAMSIPHFIDGFINKYPDIYLEIVLYDEMPLNEKLSGHILIHPFIKDLNGYKQYPLAAMDLGLFASQEYLSEFGTPSTIDDLDNHRLIAFTRTKKLPFDLNWHLKLGTLDGEERVPILEVDVNLGRCFLAYKGIGIISVPNQHPDVRKYNLVKVLPNVKGPQYAYHLIVDEVLYENERIRALVEFLKQGFTDL